MWKNKGPGARNTVKNTHKEARVGTEDRVTQWSDRLTDIFIFQWIVIAGGL